MASESTETQTVTVSLPAELDDWLDDHAAALEVDQSTLLVQLLSAYRATAELGDSGRDGDIALRTVDEGTVAASVDDAVAARLDDAVVDHLDGELEARLEGAATSISADELDERVAQQVDTAVEGTVADRVAEATDAVRTQLGDRIDALESEYREALQDVRERVIQVKKDTDAKAPADHTHERLGRIDSLADDVSTLQGDLETLSEAYEETVPDHGERVDAVETRFDQVQDRLQTVAWAVSDLREAQESGSGLEAVDRIKRAAAKADIDRAKCGNCGEGVQVSLLTDPECPHCNATVTNVEPAGGWFSSPKLVAASQLESGEER